MMRVTNMISPRSGRAVANQFVLSDGNGRRMFQSYDSPIVEIDSQNGTITVYPHYDYSVTTGKYRNQFMDDNGFGAMADKKGFEDCMNAGQVGRFKIVKAF